MAVSTIELCSGVGMLGEGLRSGLRYMGIETRAICHVEREAYAASVLVARMEEGSLDAAPVWSDLCTFDAQAWHGKVDCVVAGFPCQDLSVAGKRAGLDGKRSGLFFEVVRIAADCGAWLMLLENVAGIASATATVMDPEEGELDERAAARVVGELADCGWNAEWITISASDVGASHGRARWFCLAWRVDDAERSERRPPRSGSAGRQQGDDGRRAETHGRAGIANEVLGDSGLQHGELQQRRIRPEYQGAGVELDDPAIERREARPGIDGAETAMVGASCGEFGTVDQRGVMAEPVRIGWSQGRPESGGQQGRLDADERGLQVADAGRIDARRVEHLAGAGRSAPEHQLGSVDMADARCSRQQRPEFGISCDGNRGGRKHMDQLANFVAYSPLAQTIRDGQESSTLNPGSALPSASKNSTTPRLLSRRLNPYFGERLMGWPLGWTSTAERSASSASATELWRSKLQQQLSSLLGEPGYFKEAA